MMISFKNRVEAEEELDNFEMCGDELAQTLEEIAEVNQMLGGNGISLKAVEQLLANVPSNKTITIIDVGCGNGDMLRSLARLGRKHGYNFKLIGIDANPYAMDLAKELSVDYSNLNYAVVNIFDDAFAKMKYDIALCTLTLHHFKDDEIMNILKIMTANATIGVIVNDLQRSALAYGLFKLYSWAFKLSSISKADGLTSILRGFKKEDLQSISKKLNFNAYSIQWKWAFRYLWIIKKENAK